jgi:FtsP/CotA-like multicopper oxidase with cupredoxin domain
MLSYNGSIPWPTFRAPKGATIKFKVRNTVKELATTIHPHGVRLPLLCFHIMEAYPDQPSVLQKVRQ